MTEGTPDDAVRPYNRGVHSPDGIYVVHACVYVPSKQHGEMLRVWVEGRAAPEPMLFGWHDGCEPWMLELLIGSGATELGVEVFDLAERNRRIARMARGGQ